MTYEDNKFRAGGGTLALGIIGTVGAGLLAAGAGNSGNGLLGGLFNGNNCWNDKEVMLLRENDRTRAMLDVVMATTPYQIKEATCGMIKAEEYVPARKIVYTGGGCGGYGNGYNGGCI